MPHVRAALRGRRPLHVPHALIAAIVAVLVPVWPASLPATAHADGDPASDVLLIDNVFYSYEPGVSAALTASLNATVSRAHAAGFPIKVALIEAPLDLGAIPQLFGKPQEYARYLDIEISYNSVAKLLVVMPQGFGTFASGPVSALASIHIDTAAQSDGLAAAAILAIGRLAKLAGHPIAVPNVPGDLSGASSSAGTGGGGVPVVAVVLAVAAVALSVAAAVAWRRRRPAPDLGGTE